MDFEQFKEFMLHSAAQHDARIAQIEEVLRSVATTSQRLVASQIDLKERTDGTEEALRSLANTTQRLVDNQIYLQEKIDGTQDQLRVLGQELRELGRIVFRHVTDPNAHQSTQ